MRSFGTWKSQVMLFLIKLPPPQPPRRGTYDFEEHRRHLVNKLDTLRSRWLASFLADLHRFASFWRVQIPPDLLPTWEEITSWRE